MLALLGTALATMLLALSVAGVVAGTIKAGDGMSRYSGATWRAEERFHDSSTDMDAIQSARTRGMCDAVAGTAEAAMSAQTIGSPDVAKNPIGLGFTDGMSIAQLAIDKASQGDKTTGSGSAPSPGGATNGQAGSSNLPGMPGASGSTPSGDGGVPVEQAQESYYIAWYAKGFGFEPIFITSVKTYNTQEQAYTYPGGGIDPNVPLTKVALTGAYPTEEEARKAAYGQMSNPRTMSGIYAGMPAADIGGKVHSLEFCGGLEWWQ